MSGQYLNTIHLNANDRKMLRRFIENSLEEIGGRYSSKEIERIVEVFYSIPKQGVTVTIIND